jgi:gamma-glutamyltranspeptidase/glutathione hydrolase
VFYFFQVRNIYEFSANFVVDFGTMKKTKGVISGGDLLTVEAGAEILKAGGNAFDACIAATFMSFAASSSITSAGGGGFLLAYPEAGRPLMYDFFVQTPRTKRRESEIDFRSVLVDFGDKTQEFHVGLGSVAVPGNIAGLFGVHKHLGSLPMPELMAPVLERIKKGIQLHGQTKYQIDILTPILTNTKEGRDIYQRENTALETGDVYYLPQMADTFDYLSRSGPREFYEGEIAQKIVAMSIDGGHLTYEDFVKYEVFKRKPLTCSYRDRQILTNPPPNSGGSLIAFLLSILDAVKLQKKDHGKAKHLQAMAEAMRLSDLVRKEKVEPGLHEQNILQDLFEADFIGSMRRTLKNSTHKSGNTTHVSVVDRLGNMASCTTSVGEGCGHLIPGTDIMLNNMLGEEDLNKQGFHNWVPDLRMSSMMSPAVVISPDGSMMALGSGGSNRIRSAISQAIANYVDFDLAYDDIVNTPRIHLEHGHLDIEPGFSEEEVSKLSLPPGVDLFHWREKNMYFGGVHAVFKDNKGQLEGAGDRRRAGQAIKVY